MCSLTALISPAVSLCWCYNTVLLRVPWQRWSALLCHCAGVITLSYYVFDSWCCSKYWYVFGFCCIPPAITELSVWICDFFVKKEIWFDNNCFVLHIYVIAVSNKFPVVTGLFLRGGCMIIAQESSNANSLITLVFCYRDILLTNRSEEFQSYLCNWMLLN